MLILWLFLFGFLFCLPGAGVSRSVLKIIDLDAACNAAAKQQLHSAIAA